MRKSFSFEGNLIHRLNQVQESHQFVIQIGPSQFTYSKSQLAFLSNKALKYFRHSEFPFKINLPNDCINFNLNDLISCFKSIDSLFHSQTEIVLNENNLHAFEYLSNFLDKRSLTKACKDVSSNVSPVLNSIQNISSFFTKTI
jgi:hypothetical protein